MGLMNFLNRRAALPAELAAAQAKGYAKGSVKEEKKLAKFFENKGRQQASAEAGKRKVHILEMQKSKAEKIQETFKKVQAFAAKHQPSQMKFKPPFS